MGAPQIELLRLILRQRHRFFDSLPQAFWQLKDRHVALERAAIVSSAAIPLPFKLAPHQVPCG